LGDVAECPAAWPRRGDLVNDNRFIRLYVNPGFLRQNRLPKLFNHEEIAVIGPFDAFNSQA
jgi:hypothetical protein